MTNELIERYIYAATKRLPKKIREDVSRELQSIIDDMLTERCGDLTPSEKDIRLVLTELGTPQELCDKYSPDSEKCLIGSPYYSTYKYVLKLVLICAGIGIAIAAFVEPMFNAFNNANLSYADNALLIFIEYFKNLFTMLPSALVAGFTFVTLLFAYFYHKNIKIDNTGNLDSLPSVPLKKEKISKVDSIVGIAITIVFLCVFLICPQVFCAISTSKGLFVPIFNIDVIHSTWYLIALFGAVGITREAIKLIEGRYNKKVMIATIIADIISAVFTVIWLARDNIINNDFVEFLNKTFIESGKEIPVILTNISALFMGCILLALLIDTIDTVVRTLKAQK